MNLNAHHLDFKVWASVQLDIDHITMIWRGQLADSEGPYLFGALSVSNAM